VIAAAQFVGAFGRIAIGVLSDRVGSRVGVLRWVAVSGVVSMSAVALSGALQWNVVAGLLLVLATAISVADNGLAFMSVAEAAGPGWSGKALGLQNTGQYIAATAVGPAIGALIGATSYAAAFALVAITPLLSIPLVPKRDQHWDEPGTSG
jgi:MFS family permease